MQIESYVLTGEVNQCVAGLNPQIVFSEEFIEGIVKDPNSIWECVMYGRSDLKEIIPLREAEDYETAIQKTLDNNYCVEDVIATLVTEFILKRAHKCAIENGKFIVKDESL